MALSANNTKYAYKDVHTSGEPYTASGTVYYGSLVQVNDSGYIVAGSHANNYKFVGVCIRGNAETGHTTDKVMVVNSGKHVFTKATAAITDIGALAYLSADDTVVTSTAGITHACIVGKIVEIISSSLVLIDLSDRVTGQTS